MTKTVRSDSAGRAPEATSGPASFDEVVEVRFRQSELASELVSATLWTSGCEGSIFDDDGADVIVTAWFPESSRREALEALNAIDGVAARIDRR
jgi:hypothetical protein